MFQTSVKCKFTPKPNLLSVYQEVSHLPLWEWYNLPTQCLCPEFCWWMESTVTACTSYKQQQTRMRICLAAYQRCLSCLTGARHAQCFMRRDHLQSEVNCIPCGVMCLLWHSLQLWWLHKTTGESGWDKGKETILGTTWTEAYFSGSHVCFSPLIYVMMVGIMMSLTQRWYVCLI